MRKNLICLVILATFIAACTGFTPPPPPTLIPTPTSTSIPIPTLTPTPTTTTKPFQNGEYIEPVDAYLYVDQIVTVRISSAYCNYKSSTTGQPTFCNDIPFPDNTFTLVIWGEDWSSFDGKCLLVTGKVLEFDGKYEIEIDKNKVDKSVSVCPP